MNSATIPVLFGVIAVVLAAVVALVVLNIRWSRKDRKGGDGRDRPT